MLTKSAVLKRLCAAIDAAGGVRSYSRLHGISPAYVSRAARGEMPIGQKIEAALGLRRVEGWVKQ